jgi:hypothetical protein
MKHPKLVWNLNTRQWFCTACGRTSDDVTEQNARAELDQLDCQLPYVEIPEVQSERIWWRRVDSNHGPTDYETVALAT